MAKVNANPEDIKRFARDLHRFNHDLTSLLQGINGKMHMLEGSWQDQEQQKFQEQFQQANNVLLRFIESSDQHVKFLMRKAQHIENYLNER